MTSRPLELIHVDLFGPTKTENLSGNQFVFVLVDDFQDLHGFSFLDIKMKFFRILIFSKKG